MPVVQQQWSVSGDGGYLGCTQLSNEVRFKAANVCRFRQFVRPESDIGKNKGDTLYFDKVSKVATGGGALGENDKIPYTKMAIKQGSLSVNEYGNAIAWTGKLEDLAQLDIESIVIHGLTDDMNEVLDTVCANIFRNGEYFYTPTGSVAVPGGTFATGGVAGATATRNFQVYDNKQLVRRLKRLNVPKFDGQNYMAITSTTALAGLEDDSEFIADQRELDPSIFFNGEVKQFYNTRYVEETNVLSNSLAGGLGELVMFGWDPVVEGIVIPEELRYQIGSADFGRDKGLAWYGLMGWARTWNFTIDAEFRIIRVSSL